MPVARAYLEHHVVLAVLLHELLAVAHVPAQICEVGWGKRSARGSPRRSERQIAAAESRRTFLQSLEVIRLDRELVLDRLQGRHRGLCPLPRVRRARSEWRVGSSSARESSACQSARRTSDFKKKIRQLSVRRANEAPTSRQLPPPSHTRLRGLRSRARARVGACSTPSTCSRPRARWVRYGYAAPGRRASRPRRARVSPSPLPFPFSTLLRPSASDASPAPRVRRSWRTSRAARLV